MQNLRRPALLIAAVVLAPALSSCMNYATDNIYTPAAGVNDRDGGIDVLNAAIVSTDGGTGRFIASLNNDDASLPNTFAELAGAGEFGTLRVAGFDPVEIPANAMVNLAAVESPGGLGIPVAGSFGLGDFVEVELAFGDGSSTMLEVPVLPNADAFAGISGLTESNLERPVPPGTFLLEPEGEGEPHITTEPENVPEGRPHSEEAE